MTPINIRGLIGTSSLKKVDQEKNAGAAMVTVWENANTCGYFATASSEPLVCGSPSVCATNTASIVACTIDGGLGFYKDCLNGRDYKDGKCDNLDEFDMILCCGGDGSIKATECGTLIWTATPKRTMLSCVKTAGTVYMLDEPLAVIQSAADGSGGDGVAHTPATTTSKQATLSVSTVKGSYSFPLPSSISTESLIASDGIGDASITTALTDNSTTAVTKSVTITSIIVSTGTITGTESVFITGTTTSPFSSVSAPTSSTTAVAGSSSGISDGAKAGIAICSSIGLLVLLGGIAFIFKKRSSFYQHAGVQLKQMEPKNNETNGADTAPKVGVAPMANGEQNDGQTQESKDNNNNAENLVNTGSTSGVVHAAVNGDDNNNFVTELEGSPVFVAQEAPARGIWGIQRGKLFGLFKGH